MSGFTETTKKEPIRRQRRAKIYLVCGAKIITTDFTNFTNLLSSDFADLIRLI
jgi:hypothetical protein